MAKSNGLLRKINRAFLLQAGLLSIAALLSVYFAKIVIEEILIKNAIQQEADYFWQKYQQNENFNLPDTLNLTGYLDKQGITEIAEDQIDGLIERLEQHGMTALGEHSDISLDVSRKILMQAL